MKRKLCIDLRWIDCSGIGTYIKNLLPRLLSSLQGISVVGLGSRQRLSEYSWSGASNFEIIQCNPPRYSIQEQIALPLSIPRDTNLFFSPHYPIPLLYQGRIVVTVHDLSHLVLPEIRNNPIKRAYAETMLRTVRRRASVIFTVSEFSRAELIRCTEGPTADNIIPVYEGVSERWFKLAPAVPPRDRPYIVYVGNVKPHKNLGRLLHAFVTIMHRIPHDLLLVGQHDGFITGETSQFYEDLKKHGERVRVTGFVSQSKLLSLVGNAAALVMPSLYEGFGFPPLEAMAAGVPALVAQAGSLPEVCGDGALYCDPYDLDDIATQLVAIVSDECVRERLIESGRTRARQYSWDRCAATTAEAISRVL